MCALWHDGDNQTEKRRNRESAPVRLLHPAYDVAEGGSVTAAVKAIDGDDVVSGETTHYTAGASLAVAIVHSLTLCNNDTVANQASVHIVPAAGSRAAANAIFSGTIQPRDTVAIPGPWFLDPSDTIRSISSTAAANEVGLRGEVIELSSVAPGATFAVDDGDALTTSKAAYYTCPASGVQHANALATLCNTTTAAVTVTVEVRPSGGAAADRQNVFNKSVAPGETVVLGSVRSPIVLEPSDAIYAMASTGAVVSFRVSPVEYATS